MPMHESSCMEDPSFFVVSLLCCQLVSSSFDCFPCLDIRTLWPKFESSFIPWSSSCFMRTVRVASDLFDFSIHFISFLFISLISLLFLQPDTFNFLNVVDKYPAHFRWGPWHFGREGSSNNVRGIDRWQILPQGDCWCSFVTGKKMSLLPCRALLGKTVEGNLWSALLLLMPAQDSEIQKTKDHAEK